MFIATLYNKSGDKNTPSWMRGQEGADAGIARFLVAPLFRRSSVWEGSAFQWWNYSTTPTVIVYGIFLKFILVNYNAEAFTCRRTHESIRLSQRLRQNIIGTTGGRIVRNNGLSVVTRIAYRWSILFGKEYFSFFASLRTPLCKITIWNSTSRSGSQMYFTT